MSDRPPVSGAVGLVPPVASETGTPLPVPPLSWEGLFPTLSSDVQSTLLDRAARHGGLTTADLRAVPTASRFPGTDRPFARVLATPPAGLPPFLPAELSQSDRPPAEAHALAVALGCPDLVLIDLEPGPDRLHFAVELAIEAGRRGERVVILTGSPGEADAVVVRLAERADLLVARALGPGEHPERLPGSSAIRTAREHGEGVVNGVRKRVAAVRTTAEARREAIRTALAKQDDLLQLASRIEELAREELVPPDRLTAIPDSPLALQLRARADGHAAELARLDAEAQKLAVVLAERTGELASLRGSRSRGGGRRGVLGSLIRGLFNRPDGVVTENLDGRVRLLEEAIQSCTADAARVASDRAVVDEAHREACNRLIRDEVDRRQSALVAERARVDAEFRALWTSLTAAGQECPATASKDAVERAIGALGAELARLEGELDFARDWAADLEGRTPELVREFLDLVRVVVGPSTAVGADVLLPGDCPRFDRLILTAADHVAEAELPPLAQTATCWALLGNASPPTSNRGPVGHRGRRDRPAPARRGAFHDLWEQHHIPAWVCEGNRLIARLTRFDPERHGPVRVEPLVDRPEVELHFVTRTDGEPMVAAVTFPAWLGPAEARAFLATELGEVRLTTAGPVRWQESPEQILAEWPLVELLARPARSWVEIAPGVREQVAGGAVGWTAAVAFARDAGWDRDRAAVWLTRAAAADRAVTGPRSVEPAGSAPARLPAGAAV